MLLHSVPAKLKYWIFLVDVQKDKSFLFLFIQFLCGYVLSRAPYTVPGLVVDSLPKNPLDNSNLLYSRIITLLNVKYY